MRASHRMGSALGIVVFAVLALASPAWPDDGPVLIGSTGGLEPASSPDVRMDAETVQAIVYRGFAEYRVEFDFFNEGPSRTVALGFPVDVELYDEGAEYDVPLPLRAWCDGRPLRVSIGRGDGQGYFLHQAFMRHGPNRVRVQYMASPVSVGRNNPRLATPAEGESWYVSEGYDYWLHTGAGWKGSIGKAVVRFMVTDEFDGVDEDARCPEPLSALDPVTRPDSYTRLWPRTYQWVFRDIEPSDLRDGGYAYDIRFAYDALEDVWSWPEPVASTDGDASDCAFAVDDGDPSTAWISGSRDRRPWVTLAVDKADVREMVIVPGDNGSLGSFREWSRPRTVEVAFSDGSTSTVRLADEPTVQRFDVRARDADSVTLTVVDRYPGSRHAGVGISEVQFGSRRSPVFLEHRVLVQAAAGMPWSGPELPRDSEEADYAAPQVAVEPAAVASTVAGAEAAPGRPSVLAAVMMAGLGLGWLGRGTRRADA